MMNKKGAVLLRDIIFMVIIVAGLISFSTLFVLNIADEYDNTNMTTEYNDDGTSGLGTVLLGEVNNSMGEMRTATQSTSGNETGGLIGTILDVGIGSVKGVSAILKTIFLTPIYLSTGLSTVMTSLGIPTSISSVLGMMFSLILYAIIIFVIISAALRGSKV